MIPLIGKEYGKFLCDCIDAARVSIDIVMYEWRWYLDAPEHPVSKINQALVRAVRRGVVVRGLLNTPLIVPKLTEVGIKARLLADRRTLHSKLVIIDSCDLLIGSHNLTSNALTTNLETSIYIPGCVVLDRFQQFFNNLYTL